MQLQLIDPNKKGEGRRGERRGSERGGAVREEGQ